MAKKNHVIVKYSLFNDKALTAKAKILFCLIVMIIDEEGKCDKNNPYLAELANCNKTFIVQSLRLLKRNNYIDVQYINNKETDKYEKRIISISKKYFE